MKHLTRAAALAVALMVLVNSTSFATDYITDVGRFLKGSLNGSPVYVDPSITNASVTASNLKATLHSGDAIVIVMLPASAKEDLKMSTTDIAKSLSAELDDQYIVALAVGNETVAYAAFLSDDLTEGYMQSAIGLSSGNPQKTLSAYIKSIHDWQQNNAMPKQKPTPAPTPKPTPLPKPTATAQQKAQQHQEQTQSRIAMGLGLALFATFVVAFIIIARNKAAASGPDRTRFQVNDQINDLLAAIARRRGQIQKQAIKDSLAQMCLDIEKYFQRSSANKQGDALYFKSRLTEVLKVLDMYIMIQNNERYYPDAKNMMAKGESSIDDFSRYVLDAIQKGNTADLVEFEVNTDILKAQSYR